MSLQASDSPPKVSLSFPEGANEKRRTGDYDKRYFDDRAIVEIETYVVQRQFVGAGTI